MIGQFNNPFASAMGMGNGMGMGMGMGVSPMGGLRAPLGGQGTPTMPMADLNALRNRVQSSGLANDTTVSDTFNPMPRQSGMNPFAALNSIGMPNMPMGGMPRMQGPMGGMPQTPRAMNPQDMAMIENMRALARANPTQGDTFVPTGNRQPMNVGQMLGGLLGKFPQGRTPAPPVMPTITPIR